MAIIKCPECGKEISDKAKACPNCGYPISSANDGIVKIKFQMFVNGFGNHANQKVIVKVGKKIIWKGRSGQVAELKFDKATSVLIRYKGSLTGNRGTVKGIIDPSKSTRYNVNAEHGILFTRLVLSTVDVIDAD
ncbi:MAG: zinc ribbon domain-containing protein [Bacilli bacterium]|jgi:hypothetical protein|nr:zinc ribbon domain-containing protein [Bacilli bacterium]